jgi:hypothetical protein
MQWVQGVGLCDLGAVMIEGSARDGVAEWPRSFRIGRTTARDGWGLYRLPDAGSIITYVIASREKIVA